MSLLMRPGRLRGPELRYLRHACDLTQEQLAHRLDVLRAAVIRWERGAAGRLDRARTLHLRMVLLKEFQQVLSEPEGLAQEAACGIRRQVQRGIRAGLRPGDRGRAEQG